MKQLKYQRSYFFAFFIGFFVLGTGSTIQKIIIDADITLMGYLVPLLFGGSVGVLMAWWYLRQQELMLQLKQKNDNLQTQRSEVLELNARLEESMEALQAAKMKADENIRLKEAFLHNLNHEIRTPMNGIIGFAELLKIISTGEKSLTYSQLIIDNSHRLLNIVENILEISQLESTEEDVKRTVFDLHMFLRELYNMHEANVTDKLSFVLKTEKELENKHIDAERYKLEKIFSYLLQNAFQFTDEGVISFGYRYQNQELVFFVEDTGIGIPADIQDRIFERFFQQRNNNRTQGLGLGLSIAKRFVELQGGQIWFESTEGKGSTFYFKLAATLVV